MQRESLTQKCARFTGRPMLQFLLFMTSYSVLIVLAISYNRICRHEVFEILSIFFKTIDICFIYVLAYITPQNFELSIRNGLYDQL